MRNFGTSHLRSNKINMSQETMYYVIQASQCIIKSFYLLPIFKGPYKVIVHYHNDATYCNLITDAIESVFQASRLKMWHGTAEEAFKKAAMLDQRTSMEFEVRFSDGTVMWKPWDKDLDTCVDSLTSHVGGCGLAPHGIETGAHN
jgi:hypothetical protein